MDIIIPAIVGLVTGAIGSLIAPWVNWGIEKRKIRIKNREKLLEDSRNYINTNEFNTKEFLRTTYYSQLRPEFTKEFVNDVEKILSHNATVSLHLGGRDSGINNYKAHLLDEISVIEKKWNLI